MDVANHLSSQYILLENNLVYLFEVKGIYTEKGTLCK